MNPRAGSLKGWTRLTNLWPGSSRKKEKTQVNKIRNERGKLATDTKEIQRILRKYYEQLYANKLDNLEEMDKFLEMYNLPKINQEQSENLKKQITPNEIEAVIKNHPTNKNPRTGGFTGNFYKTLLEENTSPSQTISWNSRGEKDPMLIFWGQHYPNCKTR